MSNPTQKPTFATTQKPFTVTTSGQAVTEELILNSDSILTEMSDYYNWVYDGEDSEGDSMNRHIDTAFRLYIIWRGIESLNEDSYEDFDERYYDCYVDLWLFAKDWSEFIYDASDISDDILDHVDWSGVADGLESKGDFVYLPRPDKKVWFVFFDRFNRG